MALARCLPGRRSQASCGASPLQRRTPASQYACARAQTQGQKKAPPPKVEPSAAELTFRRHSTYWLLGAGAAVAAYVLLSGQYVQVRVGRGRGWGGWAGWWWVGRVVVGETRRRMAVGRCEECAAAGLGEQGVGVLDAGRHDGPCHAAPRAGAGRGAALLCATTRGECVGLALCRTLTLAAPSHPPGPPRSSPRCWSMRRRAWTTTGTTAMTTTTAVMSNRQRVVWQERAEAGEGNARVHDGLCSVRCWVSCMCIRERLCEMVFVARVGTAGGAAS